MYLVNPIDGSESLVQWASRRQTSMATSAPEAEVSAMAEGFAASIFLFDSLKELKLVKGVGPSCILSMKTDSAVALKQLNTQSVTVRSRTAAQKLTYLRELVYQAPQVEPIYISGQSQRADGQTKILSGQPLREAQRHFNLIPHAVANFTNSLFLHAIPGCFLAGCLAHEAAFAFSADARSHCIVQISFFLSWFFDWVCGGGDLAFCDVVTKIKLHIKTIKPHCISSELISPKLPMTDAR